MLFLKYIRNISNEKLLSALETVTDLYLQVSKNLLSYIIESNGGYLAWQSATVRFNYVT